MKELSIEEKAKRYDEAFKEASVAHKDEDRHLKATLERIFPELEESDDERIRKEIINYFEHYPNIIVKRERKRDWIAWLEDQGEITKEWSEMKFNNIQTELQEMVELKQGDQKSADKVEPKFHEGEWVVYKNDICQIVKREEGCNKLVTVFGIEKELVNETNLSTARLWTIQDAKDGDVLADGNLPFIFKKIDANNYSYAYCGISADDGFKIESDGEFGEWTWAQDIKPATKEQRDQLEKAMADAGYTFDFEKKELKKIEQKPAWSEGDENNVTILRGLIYEHCMAEDASRLITWLESLRPQTHWKPSEEQMKALYDSIPEMVKVISEREVLLNSLYKDLRKVYFYERKD